MNVFLGIQSPKVIYEVESKYNGTIQVVEFGKFRRVIVDGVVQSLSYDSQTCQRLYWGKIIEVLKQNHPDVKKVLSLGLGGGTLAHLLNKNFPEAEMTSVEIDPEMVKIANEYFGLGELTKHHIIIGDAMRVVIDPESFGIHEYEFDCLAIDIFNGDKFPELGKSGNFIAALKKLVMPGGIIIFNRVYKEAHQDDVNIFIDYVSNFFERVQNLVVAGYTNSDNVLIFART